MVFFLTEAEVEDDDLKLIFSDEKAEEMESNHSTSSEDEMFVDDFDQDEDNDPSFYRSLDYTDEYRRFKNQAKNPVEVVKESEVEYYGKGDMSELFDPENREDVTFDSFENEKDSAASFKRTLLCFSEVENHFLCCYLWSYV